jgi:hypothetical protein
MRPSLRERVAAALGADVTGSWPVARGYTHAERWVVRMADGRSAFVKGAVDKDTAAWLRAEHRIYAKNSRCRSRGISKTLLNTPSVSSSRTAADAEWLQVLELLLHRFEGFLTDPQAVNVCVLANHAD